MRNNGNNRHNPKYHSGGYVTIPREEYVVLIRCMAENGAVRRLLENETSDYVDVQSIRLVLGAPRNTNE